MWTVRRVIAAIGREAKNDDGARKLRTAPRYMCAHVHTIPPHQTCTLHPDTCAHTCIQCHHTRCALIYHTMHDLTLVPRVSIHYIYTIYAYTPYLPARIYKILVYFRAHTFITFSAYAKIHCYLHVMYLLV